MIKCEKGGTRISGSTLDIVQDLANVIRAVRVSLTDDYSEEQADEVIRLCGEIAFAADDHRKCLELFQEVCEIIKSPV